MCRSEEMYLERLRALNNNIERTDMFNSEIGENWAFVSKSL